MRGPIVGGFLGETEGWRWLHGLMAIFTGVLWLLGTFFVPETYAPVLLRRRARWLSHVTGKVYISTLDAGKPPVSIVRQCKIALTRPWVLLFQEPIVLLTSIYIGIIYGTLYLNFAGYPIIFQQDRGWSAGVAGLPFIGTAVGVIVATLAAVFDNTRFQRLSMAKKGLADPEDRLPPAMVGSVLIPVGLFWFAWTCDEPIHWAVPTVGSAFFACGVVVVFMSLLNYLVDSYVIFAASILAANSVLRSIFGAAFPLFTRKMYENLGNHWASSVPAFLAVACVPFPFVFYKYGAEIRMKCKYAAEAAKILEKMRARRVEKEEV
ncbi:Efflux pump fub11 [Aspergillus terreus]